ncbi:hypothetical protein CF386_11825 [Paraphotobacterium marinum]|uniref:Uncharacterized protein n=2 Tax=Paraphotobacterium marinum TaxID=1755811 RepID=A0A220VH78_9GAMM|nr:hypothetical protein CF386_11825 [Paraphotobacterium marinum]
MKNFIIAFMSSLFTLFVLFFAFMFAIVAGVFGLMFKLVNSFTSSPQRRKSTDGRVIEGEFTDNSKTKLP